MRQSSRTGADRSKAVRDAFLSGAAAKVLSLAAQFLAVGIVARYLEADELGILVTLTAVTGILGFLDLGIGNASIRQFASLHSRDDRGGLAAAVATAAVAMTFLASLLALAAVPIAAIVLPTPGRLPVIVFLVLSALAIPASLGSRLALATQVGRQNNAVLLATSVAVLLGAAVASALRLDLGIVVAVFVGLPVFGNMVQTVWLLAGRHRPDWSAVSPRKVVALIVPGLPFTGMALAAAAAYQTDSLVVISVLGPAAAVGFGLLTRMFNGLTVLFMSGLQQLWASTAHALEAGDRAWVRQAFRRSLVLTMSAYLIADGALILAGPTIVHAWSDGRADVGVSLVLAFIVWNTYNFAMSQFSMLLNGAGVVGRQAIAAIAMAGVNLPLSIALTAAWGESGPLWASLIAHLGVIGVPTLFWAARVLHGRPGQRTASPDSVPRARRGRVAAPAR